MRRVRRRSWEGVQGGRAVNRHYADARRKGTETEHICKEQQAKEKVEGTPVLAQRRGRILLQIMCRQTPTRFPTS